MKTITVKQSLASLIVEGIKDIENRTWKTNFRGRVLIHAGAKQLNSKDLFSIEKVNEIPPDLLDDIENGNLPTSVIIGSVEIVDCVINHPSIWAEKTPYAYLGKLIVECKPPIYNWLLANPIKFKNPIPMKGKLSFWESECEILICPQCGGYCLQYNRDIGMPNWGNPVHQCEHCGYSILESEFEFLK